MKKILIVEDHEHIRLFIKQCLKDFDFEILEAPNGFEALKLIKLHQDIEIVLLDLMMPIVDGVYLFSRLKDKDLLNFKVCILSAKNDDESIYKMKSLGVDDYITKPIDRDILKSKINHLLNKKETQFQLIKCHLEGFIKNIPISDNKITINQINEECCFGTVSFDIEEGTSILMKSDDFKNFFNLDEVILNIVDVKKEGENYNLFLSFEGFTESKRQSIRKHTIKGVDINIKNEDDQEDEKNIPEAI